MDYLTVANWSRFQQYKDRDPKWIKFYRDVLDDYDIEQLPELSQLHLFKIWLLAAKHNNKIPNDPTWIAKKIGAKSKVNIKQLVTDGFLSVYDSVQECTETYLEEEVEEEVEKEKDKPEPAVPACPHSEIIDLYEKILPELPTVVRARWSGGDGERDLRSRWKEHPNHQSLDFWRGFFNAVKATKWRLGQNKREWKADLRFLVKRKNFDSVIQDWQNAA